MKNYEEHRKFSKSEKFLKDSGYYKEDDGGWCVGESIHLDVDFVHNGKLIVKFNMLKGAICEGLGLTSLENFPRIIEGELSLIGNKLSNFENSPIEIVEKGLFVSQNNLTCLKNSPKKVQSFSFHFNENLTSLINAPVCTGSNNAMLYSDKTKIPSVELEFYDSKYNGETGEDYYFHLYKFCVENNYHTDENEMKKVNWPKNFISSNMTKNLINTKKFNL